jgi:fatty-acid desaturase
MYRSAGKLRSDSNIRIASSTKNKSAPAGLVLNRLVGMIWCHLVGLLAFLPWFFSWTGVFLAILGIYVFSVLGMNIGYHRLLTHNGFVCSKWLERTFAVLGLCCHQGSPSWWVAVHRRHHEHTDDEQDPHSPTVGFFWAHVGWVWVKDEEMEREGLYQRYAKDILRDGFYSWIEPDEIWFCLILISWCLYFFSGLVAGLLFGWTAAEATQFALSLLVWGVFVRTLVVLHLTFFVNSAAHLWGYRNYETDDNSRNNAIIAIMTGEGWHNNHHADPRSARHGHKWWEFDFAWLTIRVLMRLGLVKNVVLPSPHLATLSTLPSQSRG